MTQVMEADIFNCGVRALRAPHLPAEPL